MSEVTNKPHYSYKNEKYFLAKIKDQSIKNVNTVAAKSIANT